MEILTRYAQSLVPGVLFAAVFLALVPRRLVALRIVSWILIFVLSRDAMTPAGLWTLGGPGFIRLPGEVGLLLALGITSVAIVALMQVLEPQMAKLVVWFRGDPIAGIVAGLAAAFLIALPVAGLNASRPVSEQGAVVGFDLAPALFLFSLFGNLYEEVLFRGYLQGYLEHHMGEIRAALLSGVGFAFFHMFLATTVTHVGAQVLFFALYEGVLCAFLRNKWGVAASTVAHGTAIFLIASGLL